MKRAPAPQYTDAVLRFGFERGKECCKYCPCIEYSQASSTRKCWMTGERLILWETNRGSRCPLAFPNSEEGKQA